MKTDRNSYLISKALKSFVLASILTAAAGQLASTFDAIVLAQFVGEECVSALSLVMPVTTFISCLGLLMAFGANALAAREIGSHNLEGASKFFSTAIWSILTIGIAFSLLMYAGIPVIMDIITDEEVLRDLPTEYLSVYVLGAWLEMLSYALCLFVATDGHPRRVMMAVFAGVLVNAVVDVLAVGVFGWGMKGAAWGSLAQYAVNILLLMLYLRQPVCSYTLRWPGWKGFRFFLENIKEGAAVSISNILMAVTVLLISNIIFDALDKPGLFCWSVCLQMLLVSVVFINGVMESLFAIGGVMLGEHDLRGFDLLSRRALILFLLGQLVLSFLFSRRQGCRVSALTQIPYSEGGRTFDSSVRYQSDEVFTVLERIDSFFKESNLSEHDQFCLNLCCEELMTNIAQHSHGHVVHHSFDIHIYSDDEGTCVTLKDGGKPFNPLLAGKMSDPNIGKDGSEHLGLRLVTNFVENISYKYMYGLNIVTIMV